MTQMQAPDIYADHATPSKTSGMAVASLVFALICCVPGFGLIAALLGIVALMGMSGKPHVKGKGLAAAGLVLGLLITAAWVVLAMSMMAAFNIVADAPLNTIKPGYEGNYVVFRSYFADDENTTDDQAQVFIDELRSRYGEPQDVTWEWGKFMEYMEDQQGQGSQTRATFPFTFQFENGDVPVEITFDQNSQVSGGDKLILEYITFVDEARGNLTFPPGADVDDAETPDEATDDTDTAEDGESTEDDNG